MGRRWTVPLGITDGKAERLAATIVQRQATDSGEHRSLGTIVTEGVQSMRPGVAVNPLTAEDLANDARTARKSGG